MQLPLETRRGTEVVRVVCARLARPIEGFRPVFREAALQFWYRWTDRDNFVMQVAHERVGDGPISQTKADIAIDWVFYQRYFGRSTSIRVGKVKAPIGIFNEGRKVTLWAGVSPKSFPTLTVTREQADGDQTSSGDKVLVGTVRSR